MSIEEIIKQTENLSPEEKQELSFYLFFSTLDSEKKQEFIDILKNKNFSKTNLKLRKPGFLKRNFYMSDDFDEPLEDFNDYMF